MPVGIRTPPEVRQPDNDGYSDGYEETRTTTEMETGAPRVRNKMRTAPRTFRIRWTMTNEVYKVFDIWWQETVRGSEREFDTQLLDDDEVLTWFTVRFVEGTYNAQIDENDKWIVSGTLRTTEDGFLDRPAGTDELHGEANFSFLATGAMLIDKVLFGAASLGIKSATAKFKVNPFHGQASIGLKTVHGRLRPRPFYGKARFPFSASAQLARFGDDELILKFDAVTYTPPDGSDVTLQFDSTVYYPPHII